ncbi:MAG: hypothetical protein ACKOAQ_07635, partial [Acidimicrobiaceae bacterium]
IASFRTIIREESVTVTLTASADVTVEGKADSPLPIIGKSKSWAEIKTGRISSKGVDVSDAASPFDETVCEVVFGVTEVDEHAEIVAMKSAVVKREIFACRVTIAISIY